MRRLLTLFLVIFTIASVPCAIGQSNPAAEGPPEGWFTDFEAAERVAQEQGRPILLFFTGSDWCGPCKRLKASVLTQEHFRAYAANNLVLVYVDFPRRTKLPDALQKQNDLMAERFKVESYPTVWLLSPKGERLGRLGGMEGGPKTYVRAIRELLTQRSKG
jgi:protein disulfide-isomerase